MRRGPYIDATPLLDAFDRRHVSIPSHAAADHRALLRARHTGTVSEPIADRIALRWLDLQLELIYGAMALRDADA